MWLALLLSVALARADEDDEDLPAWIEELREPVREDLIDYRDQWVWHCLDSWEVTGRLDDGRIVLRLVRQGCRWVPLDRPHG